MSFASKGDLVAKKTTFEQLSAHCWAYTAEGDPNSGVIIGDDSCMVLDTTATPAMAQDLIRASFDERRANPRSTSAKLRWAVKARG